MSIPPSPLRAPQHVLDLLARLHKESAEQESKVDVAEIKAVGFDAYMEDKFIALDEDKCLFTYQLLRATNAQNVVEAGTSYGVSTIYLALALKHNGAKGKVIATENEAKKIQKAKEYWAEAGEDVVDYIDLREGDLRETLKTDIPTVDLLLLDIWTPMALPTLKLIEPHFRRGAILLTDCTAGAASGYKDLFGYIRAEGSPYLNQTLPFSRGLEMSVYAPQG